MPSKLALLFVLLISAFALSQPMPAHSFTEKTETASLTTAQLSVLNADQEALNLGTVDRLNFLSTMTNPAETALPPDLHLTVDGDLYVLPGGLIYAVENGVVKRVLVVDGKPSFSETDVTIPELSLLQIAPASNVPASSATISLGGSAQITGGSVISISTVQIIPAPGAEDASAADDLLLEKIRRDQLAQAEAERSELERLIQAARRKGDANEIERLTRLLRDGI